MSSSPTPSLPLFGRVAAGLWLAASCGVAGATLGMLWVKLFVPRRAMGWDGLADVLGGLMIGGLVGLVGGAVLALRLTPRRRAWAGAGALGLAVAVFAGLVATAPDRTAADTAVASAAVPDAPVPDAAETSAAAPSQAAVAAPVGASEDHGPPPSSEPEVELLGLFAMPILGGVDESGEPVAVRSAPRPEAPVVATVIGPGDLVTRELAYELPAAVVREAREGWLRIELASGGEGWVAESDGRFVTLAELLPLRLAYLDEDWDGRLWPEPGAGNPFAVTVERGEGAREEHPVEVLDTRTVGGALWLRVRVLAENPCDGATGAREAAGWVPAYDADGRLVAWYWSRGC